MSSLKTANANMSDASHISSFMDRIQAEKRYQTIETVREDKLPRFWAAVVRFVSACDVES